MLELLLRFGARPDHHKSNAPTPLLVASQNGQGKCVELLLKHGARAAHQVLIKQGGQSQLMAPLNAALNKIAKERPAEPLKALAALLAE